MSSNEARTAVASAWTEVATARDESINTIVKETDQFGRGFLASECGYHRPERLLEPAEMHEESVTENV